MTDAVWLSELNCRMGQMSKTGTASWNGHMESVNVFYSKFIEHCKWSRMDDGLLRFTELHV
jgi:hypothetical protein